MKQHESASKVSTVSDDGRVWPGEGDPMATGDRLLVEHCGDGRVVDPSTTLTFGRAADLVVDANPYLHRVVGRFRHDGRSWWVDNLGRSVTLTLLASSDLSSSTVGPGASAPILQVESVVAFTAGPADYEVAVIRERAERLADLGAGTDGPLVTLEWGHPELNSDQWELLAILCEHRLERPADQWAPIPSNRACASRLGWTMAKFNRKLDHLCEKLERAGVRGLRGDLGLSAVDRRRLLVEHAVRSGLLDRRPVGELGPVGEISAPAAPRPRRRV
ncbi:hypothetical protein [Dermatobacter hominis]|uniref:hypothetical protein n=1 Tax=Dermatobacter hominis TaxID=2884263 RepID=UPI001D101849|nr:hypothetical protein [Dermatobacter hominis]UDY37298.1 hypothetical protein LH044_07100 [Dermatobacter hominis]